MCVYIYQQTSNSLVQNPAKKYFPEGHIPQPCPSKARGVGQAVHNPETEEQFVQLFERRQTVF